jgi:hypothetical protein
MEDKNTERELDNPQAEKKIKIAVNDISADTAAIKKSVESLSQQIPALSATREEINEYQTKLSSATAAIKRGVTVTVLPVELSEEHVALLNNIKSGYDMRNQRWERLCKAMANSGKLKVCLAAIISALISAGIMLLVFCNSHYVWGHRMLVAAIDMNHENPIGQYLTCMAEMPKNPKGFKRTIKAMERQAEKTLFLESVLKDYIEEEFLVEKYEARKTDYLEYAVFCRFTGSSDVHVFNIFIKDEEVIKVTKKYTVPSKKKGGIPKCTWKEVRPIERKTE